MPELPEVETIIRSLWDTLVGRELTQVRHVRADMVEPAAGRFSRDIEGSIVAAPLRRGKNILMGLTGMRTLLVHLGMTGRLTVAPAAAPVLPHTHLVIDLTDAGRPNKRMQLRFVDPRRFGRIRLHDSSDAICADLGPDALTIRAGELLPRLRATRRVIKAALLDQSLIAGLGNIYADESLSEAAIDPRTPADTLSSDDAKRLAQAIRSILRSAIRCGGSSIRDYVDGNGKAGSFQKRHRVYGREALPCRRCGGLIQRIVLGGRSTHFCPKCQSVSCNPSSAQRIAGGSKVCRAAGCRL